MNNENAMTSEPEEPTFSHAQIFAEVQSPEGGYSHPVHVDAGFGRNIDKLKLIGLLETDADNTIVIVGEKVNYYGGQLDVLEVPNTKVMATNRFFDRTEDTSVKAIMENNRVIAFATNAVQAKEYIQKFKKIAA